MEEKMEALYQEYLKKKLDLVFNINSDEIINESKREDTPNKKDELFFRVYIDGKYNFEDEEGEKISQVWYDDANDFKEGYAVVVKFNKNTRYNFINTKGELLCKEWYDIAYDFNEGAAKVENKGRCNFVNRQGQLISSVWLDEAWDFNEGYAKVEKKGNYNFIKQDGSFMSEEWFDAAQDFKEGTARVKKEGKYNFIKQDGSFISEEWFDYAEYFRKGYAEVRKKTKYNLIDTKGRLISDEWYDQLSDFNEGYVGVTRDHWQNFIDTQGKLVSEEWFDYAWIFQEGMAKVRKNKMCNFINTKGKLISEEWFDDVWAFENGITLVAKDGKRNFIDKEGNELLKKWYKDTRWLSQDHLRCENNNKPHDYLLTKDEDNKPVFIKIEETLTDKYNCITPKEKIKIKYEPLKFYGLNYIVCRGDNTLYLYNINSNSYENIGYYAYVKYDDNFIIYNGKTYFMYEGKKIDVSRYYSKLDDYFQDNEIKTTPGIDIMTREDFDLEKREEKRRFLEEEKENQERLDILGAKNQNDFDKAEATHKMIETLKVLRESVNELNSLKSKIGNMKIPKVSVENIFTVVEDHRKIMDELKDTLEFINLSHISFKGVDISGIDFKGCNINLYPQEVYEKNLRDCDFTGVNLSPFIDFKGVDIRGAKFSTDSDPTTIDVIPNFEGAIYDEKTTYNGKSLVDILGPCEIIKDSQKKS